MRRQSGPVSFTAPWSRALIVISAITTLFCVGLSGYLCFVAPGYLALVPALIVAGAAPFTIRGYRVTGESVFIQRLLWETRLPREEIVAAHHDPEAMRSSIRLIGNGGLFGFSGRYRGRKLGNYRALVTNPGRAVVIRLRTGKTIVLSPGDPEGFVAALELPKETSH